MPRLAGSAGRLPTIPGAVPSPGERPPGCPFVARCPRALARCAAEFPPLEQQRRPRLRLLEPAAMSVPEPLLAVEALSKHFPAKGGGRVHALNGVSLEFSGAARRSASSASRAAASRRSRAPCCG